MDDFLVQEVNELLSFDFNEKLKNEIINNSDSLVNELFENYYKNGRDKASNYLRLLKSRLTYLNELNKELSTHLNKDLVIEKEINKINKFEDTEKLQKFVKNFLIK